MITDQKTQQGGVSFELPLTLVIEGHEFQWQKQYITGKEIRDIAGLPDDALLYLSVTDPWDDELISIESNVDLAREGVEYFYVRHPLSLIVDGVHFEWKAQYISGAELKKLAKLSATDELFLLLQTPYEDEVVTDKSLVNLARPGIEQFKVKKKGEDILVSISINDKPYSIKRGPHKVAELKQLAGIPLSDELSELRNGKLIPLQDQATVSIKGGELFFSCKREGASS